MPTPAAGTIVAVRVVIRARAVRTIVIMRTVVTVRPAVAETVRPRPTGAGATTTADATERGDDRLDWIGGLLVRHEKSIYVT